MSERRVAAGVPTGGQFATSHRDEPDVTLTPARAEVVGSDAGGVELIAGDGLRKIGAGPFSTRWTVQGRRGEKVTVASESGARRHVDASGYVIDRPSPAMPDGRNNASLHGLAVAEQLRDDWADRDPAFAAEVQAVIDDLPMRTVGRMYREDMITKVAPEDRRTVAESRNYPLYFSLRAEHNGYSHDDALTAANGHSDLPHRPPTEEALRAMGDEEFSTHRLVWGIRNDDTTRQLVKTIEQERRSA